MRMANMLGIRDQAHAIRAAELSAENAGLHFYRLLMTSFTRGTGFGGHHDFFSFFGAWTRRKLVSSSTR
jgi:hypothetical protein